MHKDSLLSSLPDALTEWMQSKWKNEDPKEVLKGFALLNRKVSQVEAVELENIKSNAKQAYFIALSERADGPQIIRDLLAMCDYKEHVIFFSNLTSLAHPRAYTDLAREGSRTNIVDVFDAIALRNDFPATHFDEIGWNQLIMKAIFLDRPLYLIHNIESRNNLTLAATARDFIQERFAADRKVNPEICRLFVGLDFDLSDVKNIDQSWNDELFHEAIVLAKTANTQSQWQSISAKYFNPQSS